MLLYKQYDMCLLHYNYLIGRFDVDFYLFSGQGLENENIRSAVIPLYLPLALRLDIFNDYSNLPSL